MRGNGRVFLRGTTFWIGYYLRGKEFRESAKTGDPKEAAKFLKRRLREVGADVIGARKFTTPQSQRLRVGDLIQALRKDYELRGKLSPQSASHLDRVERDFGQERAVDLTTEEIDAYISRRQKEADANSFINRTTQLLGQAYKLAIRRGHLNHAPAMTRLSELGNVRKGFVEEQQLKALLSHLPADGLRDFVAWLAATGQRKGEASLLTWDMVHGDELHIPADICKNGLARVLPLTAELSAIIQRRQAARPVKANDGSTVLAEYIFHRGDGRCIALFRKSWATACRKASCLGLLVHDLRRSAARRLIRAGVSPEVAKRVTGHRSNSMFSRYAIVVTEDVREALEKAAQYRETPKQKVISIAQQ